MRVRRILVSTPSMNPRRFLAGVKATMRFCDNKPLIFYLCLLCKTLWYVIIYSNRGLSSTVRKCVSRETGIEYAVKIIDKSQDEAVTESITAEMQVLTYLPRHPNISEFISIH